MINYYFTTFWLRHSSRYKCRGLKMILIEKSRVWLLRCCVHTIVVLRPINASAIYRHTPKFSEQLAITAFCSSMLREFIHLIWSQTDLINRRLKRRSSSHRIIESVLCRVMLDLWETLCCRFISRKRLCLRVFTQFFSLLLSESNGVYMRGVEKSFVCLGGGVAERDTEGRTHTSRFSKSSGWPDSEKKLDMIQKAQRHSHSILVLITSDLLILPRVKAFLSEGITTNYNSTRFPAWPEKMYASDLELISAYWRSSDCSIWLCFVLFALITRCKSTAFVLLGSKGTGWFPHPHFLGGLQSKPE